MDNKKNVFWLAMTSFFTDVSSEMIMSLLPLFLASLGASRAVIGLIEGIAETTSSFFKILSGWVSDKLQARKNLVFIGYLLSTIFKPFIAIANTWHQVLSVRFVDRIGKGIRNAPRDALIADSVPIAERGRSFGFQRAMDTFGAVVGTIFASILLFVMGKYTNWDIMHQYRTIFWLSVIPGILGVMCIGFMVRDVKLKAQEIKKNTKLPSLGFAFYSFIAVSAVFEFSNFSYAIFILRAESLGVIIALIPIIYLVYNLVYAFLAQPLGVLADKIGKKSVLFMGYALASLLCLGFAYAGHQIHAWGLFIIYGVVSAITNTTPRAILADLVSSELRGSAYGIYYMVTGFIALPTSAIAGLLWDRFGVIPAFLYGGIIAAIAALLVVFLIPGKRNFLGSNT